MKKIMILGAGDFQVPLIKEAKKMGLNVIVIGPKGEYPGFELADQKYYLDVRDREKILELAKNNHIDGIATDQTDLPVRTVAYIAEKLGLYGIGSDTANLFSDKYLMREKCRSLGLPVLNYGLFNDISSATKYCEKYGFPKVIKPVDNQGSRGVFKIYNIDDLEKFFVQAQNYSSNNSVLIEEFIDGWEFVVDSLTINHEYKNLIIGDSHLFKIRNMFIPKKRLFPTIVGKETQDQVLEMDRKIIRGYGLRNGITFAEYIWDKKTNKIYLLEIGARGQGVYISSDIIPEFTGLNVNRFILNTAIRNSYKVVLSINKKISAGYMAFYLPEGIVTDISGIKKLNKIDGVIGHNLYSIKKNQQIRSIDDKSARKTIALKAYNRKELDILINRVKSILTIKVKTQKGLSSIVWD